MADRPNNILDDIKIEVGGEEIIIPAGTKVESFLYFDIYELTYSYSFSQDDRIDLGARFGLYIMPIDFGIKAVGLVELNRSAAIMPLTNLLKRHL